MIYNLCLCYLASWSTFFFPLLLVHFSILSLLFLWFILFPVGQSFVVALKIAFLFLENLSHTPVKLSLLIFDFSKHLLIGGIHFLWASEMVSLNVLWAVQKDFGALAICFSFFLIRSFFFFLVVYILKVHEFGSGLLFRACAGGIRILNLNSVLSLFPVALWQ